MKNNFKEEQLALVEKELKQGKLHEEIAPILGMHKSCVGMIKKVLMQEGRITQNEINEARNKAAKEAGRKKIKK